MRTTRPSEFRESLISTGGYHTADDCRAPRRAKPGAWTTFRFTLGTVKVFPYCAIMEPLGRLTTEKWADVCFSSVTSAERLGMNVLVEGFANRLAHDGPVVYLSNHMSMIETIMLPPILMAAGPFSYVAKASLAHLPFLTRAAEHMRMVPISRKSPREDLVNILRVGAERLGGGESFLIFPQGTRCDVFSRKRYSSIGAKLAERAGCPIVPIVVDTRCQPTRTKGLLKGIFKDFGPVDTSKDIRIAFGPAIPCAKSKAMHEEAFEWMASKLESWSMPVER